MHEVVFVQFVCLLACYTINLLPKFPVLALLPNPIYGPQKEFVEPIPLGPDGATRRTQAEGREEKVSRWSLIERLRTN